MKIEPFLLESFFARHEFSAPFLLSCSDCDGLEMAELLAIADPECRTLWDALRLGYTESRGLPRLREEITRLYAGIGRARARSAWHDCGMESARAGCATRQSSRPG